MKKITRILSIFITAIFMLTPLANAAEGQYDSQLFESIQELVNNNYVFDVSQEQLYKGAIEGMLKELGDPYTAYFTKEEYAKFYNTIERKYSGIGVVMLKNSEGAAVIDVLPNSPAEKVGIQTGDKIIAINGKNMADEKIEQISLLLRGDEGTMVQVTFKNSSGKVETAYISRQDIQLPQVESKMLNEEVGYIVLRTFGKDTHLQLLKAYQELKEQGMEKLILDLRGNGGGVIETALKISGLFIDGPAVYIAKKDGVKIPWGGIAPEKVTMPMVVLVDGGTASAAEILAGALKDYDKGILVGAKTFGKGIMQQVIPVGDGFLKLTFAQFYRPSETPIHQKGITPDYVVKDRQMQLPTAVRILTGKSKVEFAAGSRTAVVNGLQVNLSTPAYKDKGGIFLPLRFLVDAFGGEVNYLQEQNKVIISLNGDTYGIGLDRMSFSKNYQYIDTKGGLKYRDGALYISTSLLKAIGAVNVEEDGKGQVAVLNR
jgi:carboxyl-terminal processing protease